jgi:hypothetical protein
LKNKKLIYWVIGVLVLIYLVKESGVLTGLQGATTYDTNNVGDGGGSAAPGSIVSLVSSGLQEYDGSDDD